MKEGECDSFACTHWFSHRFFSSWEKNTFLYWVESWSEATSVITADHNSWSYCRPQFLAFCMKGGWFPLYC